MLFCFSLYGSSNADELVSPAILGEHLSSGEGTAPKITLDTIIDAQESANKKMRMVNTKMAKHIESVRIAQQNSILSSVDYKVCLPSSELLISYAGSTS